MSIGTLRSFIKSIHKSRSYQVYQCDALWIIGNALGNKFDRYATIVEGKKAPEKGRTTEEVVDELVMVLKNDAERRVRNGEHSV